MTLGDHKPTNFEIYEPDRTHDFEASPLEFKECAACEALPGSPSCLQNRSVIDRLITELSGAKDALAASEKFRDAYKSVVQAYLSGEI